MPSRQELEKKMRPMIEQIVGELRASAKQAIEGSIRRIWGA